MGSLRVIFLGGKQAGLIGLLTTIVASCEVKAVVTCDSAIEDISGKLGIPIYDSVKLAEVKALLPETDLMISVHSREIIPPALLAIPRLGGINVHPCLAKYKGKNPISRFFYDSISQHQALASVGIHYMTAEVDLGETILERFIWIDRQSVNSVIEVYNILYPLYSLLLFEVLKDLEGKQ